MTTTTKRSRAKVGTTITRPRCVLCVIGDERTWNHSQMLNLATQDELIQLHIHADQHSGADAAVHIAETPDEAAAAQDSGRHPGHAADEIADQLAARAYAEDKSRAKTLALAKLREATGVDPAYITEDEARELLAPLSAAANAASRKLADLRTWLTDADVISAWAPLPGDDPWGDC